MTLADTERSVELDSEGYLLEPDEWDECIAERLAAGEGVSLSEEHWRIIGFMRDYYAAHRVAADARFAIRFLADEMGYGKRARNYLFQLFPYGYVQQACKIAGMKRPRGWSTG